MREAGFPALVAAPGRIPRPANRSAKTDSLDCCKLAEYAARAMLAPVFVPEKQVAGVRTLHRRRHKLTDLQRKAKRNIRAPFGETSPLWDLLRLFGKVANGATPTV